MVTSCLHVGSPAGWTAGHIASKASVAQSARLSQPAKQDSPPSKVAVNAAVLPVLLLCRDVASMCCHVNSALLRHPRHHQGVGMALPCSAGQLLGA